ncbi:MAG: hypothetical protein MJ252_07715 [archaeon]|nr:hypothetical protein [archaeon]
MKAISQVEIQPESNLSQSMQGQIESMLEEVISTPEDKLSDRAEEEKDFESKLFFNFFEDNNNEKEENSPSTANSNNLTEHKFSDFTPIKVSSESEEPMLKTWNSFPNTQNRSLPLEMSFNNRSKSKTYEYPNADMNQWQGFNNSFSNQNNFQTQSPMTNFNMMPQQNYSPISNTVPQQPMMPTQNLFRPNIPDNFTQPTSNIYLSNPNQSQFIMIKKDESNPGIFNGENFVMPLRTFNFKHTYTKNQRHQPNPSNYDSSYNFFTMPTTQNNIVVPLFKNKLSMNKTLTPFEYKCLRLESFLMASKCFTKQIFEEIKDDLLKFLKNQQTSRLCQFFFDGTSEEVVHLIFKEISDELVNLLVDPYANYFILKMFIHLNDTDRLTFLSNIAKSLDWLSINKISTYPIQIIIEKLTSRREQELVLNAIKKYSIKLSLDVYGTHVIERILSNFPYDLIEPISFTIAQNFLFLANNPNGLCIIKKIIIVENKRNNHKIIQKNIEDNALVLVQNPYGNYALQTVLNYWNFEDCQGFMKCFRENFLLLSTQKYSSNVIEKCFELDPTFLRDFIKEVFFSESALTLLLKNIFGNYVLQTVLKYITEERLIMQVKKQIEICLEKIHDNKLIYKWKKIMTHYFPILN